MSECRVPVIVGVHGACIGAGLDLLSFTDIRHCTKDATFSIKEVDIGIAPDLGSVQRLPGLTGNDSLIRELVLTGGSFNSDVAVNLGLVSKVYKDKEELV